MATNKKQRPPGRRNTVVWLTIIGLFVMELFAYTWCRVECTRVGYDIENELRLRQRQTSARKNLTIELARLKSPGRIERLAGALGLMPPTTGQIKVIP
jgi:hypothetical protein